MKIQKIRSVKTPSRGTSLSAGIDFYIPDDYKDEQINLQPGEHILIPSGIKASVPSGYALIAFNKSGVCTKQCLMAGACVVDEDYTGEIHFHLYNFSNKNQIIKRGQKIIQFILLKINYENVEVVENLDDKITERGSGGFGSTGLQ